MWYIHEGMGWWMWFGAVWMFIFWGGLIGLTVWGITKLTKRGNSITRRSTLDLAEERYAKGEIKREEFEQIKKDLS